VIEADDWRMGKTNEAPDGPGRQQLELDLQLALGNALIAAKGFSAPEVGSTYARARALAEQKDPLTMRARILNYFHERQRDAYGVVTIALHKPW